LLELALPAKQFGEPANNPISLGVRHNRALTYTRYNVAMRALNPAGAFAISTDGGKTHLAATTLSRWAVAAATGIGNFQAKRIRSGVETLMASLKISSDIRGRLQSHGISGVQARHYDAYEYVAEKRHALETLYEALEGNTVNHGSNVLAFKAG
jgi:hypothetical protein